ncbi:hypothetical protein [Streptomyces sp. NPDC017868]|uniref:hypothetical protein n=1 Tax=Streptomyces sp. NPDC017868 TaxID=3365014 RepID=UPI0037BB25B0
MKATLVQIVLTLIVFTVIFQTMGGGFGPVEFSLWGVLLVGAIAYILFRHRRRRSVARQV